MAANRAKAPAASAATGRCSRGRRKSFGGSPAARLMNSGVVDGTPSGAVQTLNYSGTPFAGRVGESGHFPVKGNREASMQRDFRQSEWGDAVVEDCRHLVRLAVHEDLERQQDWTTLALVPPEQIGAANIVARQPGVVAGAKALGVIIEEMGSRLTLQLHAADG